MSGLESEAVKVGQFFMSAIIYKIKTYVNYINKCEENLGKLLDELEKLRANKDTIDEKVLSGKESSKILTPKAELWFECVRKLVSDESMKRLMNTDMRVAKVMLRLMKTDLKKLVEDDGEIRELVVKVMKDITKRKRKDGNREVPRVDENDKKVSQVLEKLMGETIDEFKKLMQNDEKMAIAAMHLLENHKEKLEELTEKDPEVADIIAKARKVSHEEEFPSDNHDAENGTKDNVVANVNTLRNKVTNLLKPVGNLMLNEEVLKTLPENVRLGVEAMGVVIGNRRGLKAELMDSDDIYSHRNGCCCAISCNYFSDRYKMSVAAEAMLVTVKEIIGSEPGSQDVTRSKRRGEMEAIPTNCVEVKSRKELLGKIIEALTSNDINAIGVFGMGGSGKTTLATDVANSKAKGIFETTVMVEVSESPNIESIQNQIGDGLGLSLHNVHGIREKAIHLYDKLKLEGRKEDNKILIVLDNIWKKIDLVQIGIIPHEYCKLLLTSREMDVCKAMIVNEANIFEVGLLNEDEAKDLFQFQVKKKVRNGEYKFLADRLLEKCRGLPLAIVATANSLKGKELPLWRQFVEELERPISCQITGARYETFSILRTSYDAMASEEKKKFFLMACLSPIGSSISIDNLMRYGIGLDLFQQVNKLSEAIERARTWAEELVSSSMLLKGDSDEYVKIHDVVRESTMSFASKSGTNTDGDGHMFLVDVIPRWICEETFNKYTGISLLAQANFAPLSGVKADLLQILLLKGNENHSLFLESNFFQGMTNLKVLEVLFMNFEKGLPESIGKLKFLKTLHLVNCKLGDIKLIGELGSLLVLSLRGSSLEGLPDEIGKLYKLRLLDMSKCQCKEPRIPANVIARLSLLEGLYLVSSSFTEWAVKESTSSDTRVSSPADIEDLTKLDFLNVLEIRIGELVLPICDQFVKNLDKFQISVGQEDFGLLPSPRSLILATKFDVSQELKKDNCLKALLKKADLLALMSATVKNIVPELDKEGCRDLSYLGLSNIDSISRICEGKAPTELFYNLCHLGVSKLENLEVLLPVNPLPLKMTTLNISDCNSLTYIFSEHDGVNKGSDIIELPCLKTLAIDGVSNLISVVKESNNDDSRRPSFFSSKVTLTSLEELLLANNKRIVNLWDKESNLQSFQNLKVLRISGCEEMESIGLPSMFLSLVQLETLTIDNCKKIQQVISNRSEMQEIPKDIIIFPKLKLLEIGHMENFECFYGGGYKMEFPRLEKLTLNSLERMTKFVGGVSSTTFFPKTVALTSLEELSLENNKRIVSLLDKESNLQSFQNLKVLRISDCEEMESIGLPSMFLSLVQLETLTINNCRKMQQVISDRSETREIPKDIITFPKLKRLRIEDMENFKCFYGGCYKMEFPRLKMLTLNSLERMTKFAGDTSSTTFFPKSVELTSLEKLELYLNNSIVQLCDEESNLHIFQNLKVMEIYGCEKMESIGPPSVFLSLVQLETLSIKDCGKMEQVISDRSETQEIPKEVITFPKLKRLNISCMENLECFYGGSYKMTFPRLQELSLYSLERMTKFPGGISSIAFFPKAIEFPCLEKLELYEVSDEMSVLWDLNEGEGQGILSNPVPNLKTLEVGKIKLPSIVFPSLFILRIEVVGDAKFLFSSSSENEGCLETYSQFPKLEDLRIEGCPNSVQQVVEDADSSEAILSFCAQVRSLTLKSALNIEVKSLHPFKSLSNLFISNLTWEYFFSVDWGFEQLHSLEKLIIDKCPNLEVIIRGGDEDTTVVFPRLKLLELTVLESMSKLCSMSNIPIHFPSLEFLIIESCNKLESLFCTEPNQVVEMQMPALEYIFIRDCDAMKSFSTRPLKGPKLERLAIHNCPKMEWFLLGNSNCDADLELPSLEEVTIENCPNMKSFSPAVLRAPKLQLVTVDDNPYPIVEIEDLNHVLQSANSSEQTEADKNDL